MTFTQTDNLIAAINRLAKAHERMADASERSSEVAKAALDKQAELLTDLRDKVDDSLD